jgi:hypothetical protein
MLNHLGLWSGVAGLAIELIFGVGPHMGLRMPPWLARAGFVTGIVLLEPISKSPEENDQAGELDEAEEVLWVVLPSDKDAALPLDPGKEAFN